MSNVYESSDFETGSSTQRNTFAPGKGRAVTRDDNAGGDNEGRFVRPAFDSRKYKYDVSRALRDTKSLPDVEITRDDRMSAVEAGDTLHSIHEMFGIAELNEDYLHAFDQALWLCHTVNSGSILQPGRAKFIVRSNEYDFSEITTKLGPRMRRFFRAFADDIAVTNQRFLDSYDPSDPVSREIVGWINSVAQERGLPQYPQYAHDSSDACVEIGPALRSALSKSKRMVLNTTNDAVSDYSANSRTRSDRSSYATAN